jgi:hypothetical protein
MFVDIQLNYLNEEKHRSITDKHLEIKRIGATVLKIARINVGHSPFIILTLIELLLNFLHITRAAFQKPRCILESIDKYQVLYQMLLDIIYLDLNEIALCYLQTDQLKYHLKNTHYKISTIC